MNKDQAEEIINASEFTRLRLALIFLTIIQAGSILLLFTVSEIFFRLFFDFYLSWVITLMTLSLAGVFIWYTWNRLPIDKKKRTDKTWMILFLGIIGMWLWLPNKKEIEIMNKIVTQ